MNTASKHLWVALALLPSFALAEGSVGVGVSEKETPTSKSESKDPTVAVSVNLTPPEPKQPANAFGESGPVELKHVVEIRPFTQAGRSEVALFGTGQVNGKFSSHYGLDIDLAYHIRESVGVWLGGSYVIYGRQSSLTDELISKAHEQPFAANALLMQWNAAVGLEMNPLYGKFTIVDDKVLHFAFYINAGAGIAKTRVQLRGNDNQQKDAAGNLAGPSFGDTGYRPAGALGGGVRIFLTPRWTLRLEVRDLIYSALVDKINGCSRADVGKVSQGRTDVASGCDAGAFKDSGADAAPDSNVKNAGIAQDLLSDISSDVINNLSFYGGVSFLF